MNWIKRLAIISEIIALIAFLAPIKSNVELIKNSGHAEIHALIYLTLFILFFKAGFHRGKVFGVLLIQGILIEFIQPYFGRGFSQLDIAGNTLGIIIGYLVSLALSKRVTGPAKKTSE